jgi:hypothetical protein
VTNQAGLMCRLVPSELIRTVIGCELGRSKRSKDYNLLKNAGVFLNIVGVAAVCSLGKSVQFSPFA